MKKIFSFALMLLGGAALLTSCSEDRDSNPTLLQPTDFVLNETNWRGGVVELENTKDSLILNWSAPQYATDNAPVIVSYSVDFSPKGTFEKAYDGSADDNTGADYVTLGKPTNKCSIKFGAKELNAAFMQIFNWKSAAEVPSSAKCAFRVNAKVIKSTSEALNPVTSNLVNITVLPYYMLLKAADPEIWYLLGSDIADGSWGDVIGEKCIPMQTIENESYDSQTGKGKIQWIGYLAGGGFKLRGSLTDGWATQWGQGAAFGDFVKNDGGSGNITVPAAGVYTITLETNKDVLTIEPYDGTPTVFDGMAIAGGMTSDPNYSAWSDIAMIPCSTAGENHDWYVIYEFNEGDEFKVKQAGSWDYNRGGVFVGYGEGSAYVYGVQNGPNLVVPENGKYMVLFNDITGYVRFIKQKDE